MVKQKIGFFKWLYTRTIEVIRDPLTQSIGAILGGIFIFAFSATFGALFSPLLFLGVPVGILVLLYGIYKVEH